MQDSIYSVSLFRTDNMRLKTSAMDSCEYSSSISISKDVLDMQTLLMRLARLLDQVIG